MKRIPLTQNQYALVDDEDYDYLMQWKWYANKDRGGCYYGVRNIVRPDGKRGRQLLHRLIMGNPVGMVVDHANRNTLDDTKGNLRICTTAENSRNKKIQSSNRSGYKGVGWYNPRSVWRARIQYRGKIYSLGYFKCPIEAHKAYCEASKKYHGDFGCTN